MGFIFTIFFPLYVLFAILLLIAVASKTKSVKITLFNLFMIIIIPGHDIVPTQILGAYYCLTDPNPKTFIKKTVEYPESIYWEDNIYAGFNEEDRKLMIKHYLNGTYLKTIALNGDDGMIYIYSATSNDWNTSRAIKARKIKGNYYKQIDKEIEAIYNRGIKKKQIPKMNFTVISNEVPLASFPSKLLYSDEISVIDNRTKEVIGYNRRLMHFFYNAFPDINLGNRYYFPEPICGKIGSYRIPARIFGYLITNENGQRKISEKARHGIDYHVISKNEYLYKKNIKDN